jgi:long-chain acyl-CoA synthetase
MMIGRTQPTDMVWVQQYAEGVPHDLDDLKPISMPEMLAQAVARFGDRPALSLGVEVWTYRDYAALVARCARGLQNLSVAPGDRVAVLMPNHVVGPIWFFGVLATGAALVSINPLYTAAAAEGMIADSGARIVLTLDAPDMRGKLEPLLQKSLLDRIVLASVNTDDMRQENSPGDIDGAIIRLSALLANDGAYKKVDTAPKEALAALQYTGGTTGAPKGAMLTHANLTTNTLQIRSWFPFLEDGKETILIPLPFTHITGITVCMSYAVRLAAELIVVPRFFPDEMLATLREKRPTFFGGVPTIFIALLQAGGSTPEDWKSVKAIICGGAPLPPDVMRRFQKLSGQRVRQIYGSTETSPGATIMPANADEPETSVGLPLPGTQIEIRDVADPQVKVPVGQSGEIVIAGPQILRGYWKRESETSTYIVDGFFRTGDIGYIDHRGYVFVVDRLKDMIIASGYNVYPANVEKAVFGHPSIAEAIVIGVPDEYRGETIKAFVTLKAGHTLTLEELQSFLKEKLSPMEIPKQLEIRDQLPKTAVGKLSRLDLKREIGIARA